MKILYCGSDDFSVKVLEAIVKLPFLKIDVLGPSNKVLKQKNVTTPYIPSIVKYCRQNEISFRQDIDSLKTDIENKQYDGLLVVSFNKFIGCNLLKHFKYSFNLHPSLLPYYKGSSPIQRSLLNNEKYIGITIQDIDSKKFDNGKIYMQTKPLLISKLIDKNFRMHTVDYVYEENKTATIVLNHETEKTRFLKINEPNSKKFNLKYDYLRNYLAIISGEMMKEFLTKQIYEHKTTNTNSFIQNLPFKQPQFAKKLSNSTFQLNWSANDIYKIINKVNITDGCCFTYLKENYTRNGNPLWRPRKIFIKEVEVYKGASPFNNDDKISDFKLEGNSLLVKCLNDAVLKINKIKPEGVQSFINAEEFITQKFKKLYKHQNYSFNTIKELKKEYEDTTSKLYKDKTIESIIYKNSGQNLSKKEILDI